MIILPVTLDFGNEVKGHISIQDHLFEVLKLNPSMFRFEFGYEYNEDKDEFTVNEVSLVPVVPDRLANKPRRTK